MNKELVRNIGSCTVDNLIAKLTPAAETFGVTIRKGDAETTYKRGTVLGMSGTDSKYVIFGTGGETLTGHCILADDVTVGTDVDAVGVAYRCGNFNRAAVIVADGYTMTAADEDAMRKYDIIFTDMM
ncbi:MAG: head decoration protein [Aristaeellaceae bacterium]